MSGLKKLFPEKIDLNRLIFKIGEVSKMMDVSTRQLRYWEQKGYITSIRDDKSRSRVFNMENLNKVTLIKHYLDKGFTLTAANATASENIANMRYLRRFMMNAFEDVETIDGQPVVNLGYFNEKKTSILYASVDENDEIKYRVVDIKKKDK
ncbi:MerR family transcriptional regulator [Lactobacillus sp. M0345]|nr:MerR family transcriptional regulator [Lactobacillus sp. M0345]